jgi:hypothetical protein
LSRLFGVIGILRGAGGGHLAGMRRGRKWRSSAWSRDIVWAYEIMRNSLESQAVINVR